MISPLLVLGILEGRQGAFVALGITIVVLILRVITAQYERART